MSAFRDAVEGADGKLRCAWSVGSPEYIAYHDDEWGFPLTDERRLFEKICLEGFQAGLSWITILRRRDGFRAAFDDFEPAKVAAYGEPDVARLLGDDRIIRHRGKIEATIGNARALLALDTPLVELVWSFAPDAASRTRPASFLDVPAVTPESTAGRSRLPSGTPEPFSRWRRRWSSWCGRSRPTRRRERAPRRSSMCPPLPPRAPR